MIRRTGFPAVLVTVASIVGPPVLAADAQVDLHRAYFLQHEQHEYAQAAAIYAKLAEEDGLSAAIREQARVQLVQCRAALQTSDFATLMPADALAYIEIRNTGDQVKRLIKMLGLLGSPTASGQAPPDGASVPMPRPELALPRLRVSPALMREFKKIGGAAIGVTGLRPDGRPEGLAVIDPGTCDLMRGLLETGLPIMTPIGEIEGWPAFGLENVAVVITERLILVGSPRIHAVAAAKALRSGTRARSLADDADFAKVAKWRKDSVIFGYVNAKKVVPLALAMAGANGAPQHELAMARALLDLDHVQSLAFRAGVTETGLSADLGIQLDEGHQSLALHFIRTPPLSRASLECVPEGAVGVLALALASAEAQYNAGTGSGPAPSITGLDFGREIFANIEEIALFVMPPGSPGPGSGAPRIDGNYIPDAGIAITVKDPSQSDALWSQLLVIPTLILGPSEASAEPTSVDGRTVTVYRFPEKIQMVYANVGNQILLGTSERAVGLMSRAKRTGKSVLTDDAFAAVSRSLGDNASKLFAVHAARACKLAASYAPKEAAIPLRLMVPNVVKDLVVCVVTHESPTRLAVHAAVENLPDLTVLLNQLENITKMVSGGHPHRGLDVAAVTP